MGDEEDTEAKERVRATLDARNTLCASRPRAEENMVCIVCSCFRVARSLLAGMVIAEL